MTDYRMQGERHRHQSVPQSRKTLPQWLVLTLVSAILWIPAQAQVPGLQAAPAKPVETTPAQQQDPLKRNSPQSSVDAFLDLCEDGKYDLARRYLDLRKLPPIERRETGDDLAKQIELILNRDARFDLGKLSNDPAGNRADGLPPNRETILSQTVNGQTVSLALERIDLRSGVSAWLFSQDSIDSLPTLLKATSDSAIERVLPTPLVVWRLAGTPLWKWIALVIAIVGFALLSRAFSRLIILISKVICQRLRFGASCQALDAFIGPAQVLLFAALMRIAFEWIAPAATLRPYFVHALEIITWAGVAWLAMRVIDLILGRVRVILQTGKHTLSVSALPLMSRVLKITAIALTVTATLSSLGYNTTTLLAGLGIGGVAIALAAQKTIENLFGGLAVVSDRPVFVGDFCKFGDRVGTIEDIGLRSTRVRTLDRTVVTVPNGEFSSMTLENFSRRDKVWFHPILNLRRDTTAEQLRTILEGIKKMLAEYPGVEIGGLPVRFVGVGAYSLDVEVFAYVLSADYDKFLQVQQDLLLHIMDIIQAAGSALAIPTQASVSYSVEPAPHGTAANQPVGAGNFDGRTR